jgi:adenylate kinase family enzyme
VNRILIVGPGASGKSTLARRLSEITGLRAIELDKVFWQPGPVATPRVEWVEIQQKLLCENGFGWILDGDLGAYDAIEVRLRAADTIILLDFGIVRCAWRALRRSREGLDFWLWLLQYRVRSRPMLLEAIRANAPTAVVHVLRDPPAVSRFVLDTASTQRRQSPNSGVRN